jgi:hypothetical protein
VTTTYNGTSLYPLNVHRIDGGVWSTLGTDVVSGAAVQHADVAFASSGVVHAVGDFNRGEGEGDVEVYSWNGTSWNQLGADLDQDSASAIAGVRLTFIGDTPWVAWSEEATPGGGVHQLRVARWNGSSWAVVGSVLNDDPARDATSMDLKIVAGVPWIAWSELNSGGIAQVHVKSWDGANWVTRGTSINIDATAPATQPRLATNGSDVWASWMEPAGGGTATMRVRRWIGAGWSSLGSSLGTGSNFQRGGIVWTGDFLIAAAPSGTSTDSFRWSGASWDSFGSLASWPSSTVQSVELAADATKTVAAHVGTPALNIRPQLAIREVNVFELSPDQESRPPLIPSSVTQSGSWVYSWTGPVHGSLCSNNTTVGAIRFDTDPDRMIMRGCISYIEHEEGARTPVIPGNGTAWVQSELTNPAPWIFAVPGARLSATVQQFAGTGSMTATLDLLDGTSSVIATSGAQPVGTTLTKLDVVHASTLTAAQLTDAKARVTIIFTGGSGNQGAVRAIGMYLDPGPVPYLPELVAPAAGVLVGGSQALEGRYLHPDADTGQLEFAWSDDASFSSGVTSTQAGPVAHGSTTSVVVGSLTPGTTYYWRARGISANGTRGPWSAPRTFHANAPPAEAVPLSPADAATIAASQATLVSEGFSDPNLPADSHTASQWQVITSGGSWASPLHDSGTTTTNLTSWAPPSLASGDYEWRVRHRDGVDAWGAWSSTSNPRSFTIDAPALSLVLDHGSPDLGSLTAGSDAVTVITATFSVGSPNGGQLLVDDAYADGAGATCTCDTTLADWGWSGTYGAPSTWAGRAGGTNGYVGISVLDATGGRDPKWGAGTGSQWDFTTSNYAGIPGSSSLLLHEVATPRTDDQVAVAVRVTPGTATSPAPHSTTATLTLVANT